MANPGIGAKFVSVNLNKSYGQQQHHHHHHHSNHSSSYGSNRTRPGGSHSGSGGGMVVLSRPRSSQKASGSKLSVPPPLNLPSLRKEHERFDSLGSAGGPAGGGVPGSGPRPTSSSMGWTKPATVSLQEKEPVVSGDHLDGADLHSVDGLNKVSSSSVYVLPSARLGMAGPTASGPAGAYPVADKAMVLRGEDFPSLQATLPATTGPEKKHKDGLNQKQKHVFNEVFCDEQMDGSRLGSLVDMRPQLRSSRHNVGRGLNENGSASHGLARSQAPEQARKQDEYFPGPLPIVRLNPRSDWADDERDTGHGLAERGRDHGFPKSEAYWVRDFDMPKSSVLPQKQVHNVFDRWGQRDNEGGKVSSSEVAKSDPYGRDVRAPSREGREGNSWRATSPFPKDGLSAQEAGNDRNVIGARPSSLNKDGYKENKYISSPYRDNAQDDVGRRDAGHGQGGRQPRNNMTDLVSSRGAERSTRERFGSEHYNRYRGDSYQNSSLSKSSFSLGGKALPVNDPILNFGRGKRPSAKGEKSYYDDPFIKDFGGAGFDGRDPFSGGLIGFAKRKKDVLKQTDFHDPVRESFEAELERVQKMQEQERQRIIEEQERAMELARREEEERLRLAREQEEQQRRLEEEAREAAWRAEQERLEAMRRAEEQRLAREEEKHRILMEEERRKQAAKQKLLELEERIAKRQAEGSKGVSNSSAVADEKLSVVKEKDASKVSDIGDWEDGERMVERITTSASSDSSGLIRPFESGSRPHFSRDNSSGFPDRGKPVNSWRRDAFENGNSSTFLPQDQENGHHSPRRDAAIGGRAFTRKEFYGGGGLMPSRSYHKGGLPGAPMDDFTHLRGHRWSIPGDGDQYRNTEIESEYHENFAEKFGDVGWGQGRARGNAYPPYPDRIYQNSEADGLYSFGRSRYSMRQPRVLPPPSLNSMHKTPYRGENECPGSSTFVDNEMQFDHGAISESAMQTGYVGSHQGNLGQAEIIDALQGNTDSVEQKLNRNTPRCDSQSSLSVSSPPDSPIHLSHDDDESGDSPLSTTGDGKDITLSGQENQPVGLPSEALKKNMMNASSSVSTGDDEEWTMENNERLQEQEEYDEDEDGYEEEDEVHEGDDENIDLTQEFEGMHLEEKSSMDNLVLGFNEGVEVGMPNDEFERSLRNEETTFVIAQIPGGTVEEQGSFDGVKSDGQTLQPVDGSSQMGIDNSSRIFEETEKAMQDLVIQPSSTSQPTVASDLLDHVDVSSSSGSSTQHPVPFSSGQPVMPSGPPVPSQAEVPVKLQFGLFSGPSLIPSPVPAIQIGSIQMPLHLHPQFGPSLTHVHPPQTPLFQFGQLRYSSPISQGVLPLAPQSMSFVQPNVPANFSLNQNPGGPLPFQPGQDASRNLVKNDVLHLSMDNQPAIVPRLLDLPHGIVSKVGNSLPTVESVKNTVVTQQGQVEISHIGDNNLRPESGFQAQDLVGKNLKTLSTRESESQPQTIGVPSFPIPKDNNLCTSKGHDLISGGRGKKYVFTAKGSISRSSLLTAESSCSDSSGFQRRPRRQRTEFRVRENTDKRQSSGLVSSGHNGMNDKSNANGRGLGNTSRSGSRKVVVPNRLSKMTLESDSLSSGPVSSREMDSGNRTEKSAGKESLAKSQNIPQSGEGNLKRNIHSEEDVDAPLQSGVVRVFEQPGIEAPSDEDDFIEVRSKRQMLNDRREQREKEIKAKSRVTKMPRKPRSTIQSTVVSASSSKISASACGEASNSVHSDFIPSEGRGLPNIEGSAGFSTTIVSQPLAPIGTPAVKSDAQTDIRSQTIKSLQASTLPVGPSGGKNLVSGLIFDSKNKVLDNAQTSMGSWGTSRINQQVMALTQTQLDEAMKPVQFDSRASVGDHSSSISESNLPSSSKLSKDKSFSSAASPINSLLAGEKIQFGAVTSPTVLAPSSRGISHGIGPPGPSRSDIQISRNLSAAEDDCSLFFEKEKRSNESCSHMEDCEAEAEAAASAVAVAAISSDEIIGNGLGACSPSVSDTKKFRSSDIDGIPAGVADDQQLGSQSKSEEPLSVALPADLSVETPPISLWPPLPSPQNTSNQMLSHFPGGPPSHFPFYEMNPMLGGPIFAFGPHDEAASAQSQSQKGNASVSSPLGTWQQCHSGVDSFYGHPTGFTGPFIGPPGGIPGVQGPPHMVVYNHFAPVGQFGQVGLSFMGTTYIPSGKQPDWKHNPTSSDMGVGEGDMSNLNLGSVQRSPANLPAPIQHLAPGSPLLPMASPLAMFDVSPFQSSADMSVQARWSHVPASTLQSIPLSMPLQQQAEGALPSQFNHTSPVDQSLTVNRFPESCTSTPSESNPNFPVATGASVTQLPDELGLVDTTSATAVPAIHTASRSASASISIDTGKADVQNGNGSGQNTSSAIKTQNSNQKSSSGQSYNNTGYNYQRGGVSQKGSSGGEWPHRRMGFQGRNQSMGAEKSFPPSKMKQIYVAKQSTSGTSTAS